MEEFISILDRHPEYVLVIFIVGAVLSFCLQITIRYLITRFNKGKGDPYSELTDDDFKLSFYMSLFWPFSYPIAGIVYIIMFFGFLFEKLGKNYDDI